MDYGTQIMILNAIMLVMPAVLVIGFVAVAIDLIRN